MTGETGTVTVVYDACQPRRQDQPPLHLVNTFDNQPAPGCQAILINRSGMNKVLCVGRETVPADFRQMPRVLIQPGTAPACSWI